MNQDPRASLKCRICEKRYVDMYTRYLGYCPNCGAEHRISVRTEQQLKEAAEESKRRYKNGGNK